MLIADKWIDYEVIDTSQGEKLERWNKYFLRRPDPQVIWKTDKPQLWNKVDARYHRSKSGGGEWEYFKKLPDRWVVSYRDMKFYVRPTGFKHTGLFPEQAVNWDFIDKKIRGKSDVKVLNLFAYTGGATLAAMSAGASVVHVDASKGMVTWAKENAELSHLNHNNVRFIVDDCEKYVNREIRRQNKYDGIIMDPPSYGRGPGGELWKIEDKIFDLVKLCTELMSDKPLFFIINSYTTGLSATVLQNILALTVQKRFGGVSYADDIGLPAGKAGIILPCGSTGRWEAKNDKM